MAPSLADLRGKEGLAKSQISLSAFVQQDKTLNLLALNSENESNQYLVLLSEDNEEGQSNQVVSEDEESLIVLNHVDYDYQQNTFCELCKFPNSNSHPANWPETWVKSQIIADSNHFDLVSNLTFVLGVDFVVDPVLSFAEVFVIGADLTFYCDVDIYICGNSTDIYITCCFDVGTFEGPGAYGPFHIIVKRSEFGPIIVEQTAFGYIFLLDSVPVLHNELFWVSYESSDPDLSISAEVSLLFSFELSNDDSLHQGDFIELIFDPNFNFYELFVSFDEGSSMIFFPQDSILVLDDRLFIYGLTQDLHEKEGLVFNFIVNGFLNPETSKAGGEYLWVLKLWRYGTETLIKHLTASGPELGIEPGLIQVLSLVPNSPDLDLRLLYEGQVTYLSLEFTIEHSVPITGFIEITFKGLLLCSKTYKSDQNQNIREASSSQDCGLVLNPQFFSGFQISSDGLTLTLQPTSELQAGLLIKIIDLVEITGQVIEIVSIISSNGLLTIDTYNKLFPSIDIVGKGLEVVACKVFESMILNIGVNQVGKEAAGFGLWFNLPTDVQSTDFTLTLRLAISVGASQVQENFLAFPSALFAGLLTGPTIDFSSTYIDITGSLTYENLKSLIFTNPGSIESGAQALLFAGGGTFASPELIFLPGLVTFLLNTPEIIIFLKTQTTTYTYTAPWTVSESNGLAVTLDLLCSNLLKPGMPGSVTLNPSYPLDFSHFNLKVQLEFNLDFSIFGIGSVLSVIGADGSVGSVLNGNLIEFFITSITESSSFTFILPGQTEGIVSVIASVFIQCTKHMVQDALLLKSEVFTLSIGNEPDLVLTTLNLDAGAPGLVGLDFESQIVSGSFYTFAVFYQGFNVKFDLPWLIAQNFQALIGIFELVDEFAEIEVAGEVSWLDSAQDDLVYFVLAQGKEFSGCACEVFKANSYHYVVKEEVEFGNVALLPLVTKAFSYESPFVQLEMTAEVVGRVFVGAVLQIELGKDWAGNYGEWVVSLNGVLLQGTHDGLGLWESSDLPLEFLNPILLIIVKSVLLPELPSSSTPLSYIGFNFIKIVYDCQTTSLSWVQSEDDPDHKILTTILGQDLPSSLILSSSVSIYPNLVESPLVYFLLSFTPIIPLLPGDIISIDSNFAFDASPDLSTWSSFIFSQVSISSGILFLTVQSEIPAFTPISILKDLALTPLSEGTIAVILQVLRAGEVILTHDLNYQVISPVALITDFTVKTENPAAGFESFYTFEVILDVELKAGSFLYFDASGDYNVAVGHVTTFDHAPGLWYVEGLDGLLYLVNHWVIEFEVQAAVPAGEMISVVLKLINPPELGTWKVYAADETQQFIAFAALNENLQFAFEFQNQIDIYSVYKENDENDDSHFIAAKALVGLVAQAGNSFDLVFPEPYLLKVDSLDSLLCSMWLGETGVLVQETCAVVGNAVRFVLDQDLEFDASVWTWFTVEGLNEPGFGSGSNFGFDWDLFDLDFDVYTRQFGLRFLVDGEVKSFAFDNLNSAFIGFNLPELNTFEINGGKDILITPGTFAGPIKIEPLNFVFDRVLSFPGLDAVSVVLTAEIRSPELSGTFEMTGSGTYLLDSLHPLGEFWLGASEDTPQGIYFILWKIQETAYDTSEPRYIKHIKTTIQVTYKTHTVSVEIPENFSFFVPTTKISLPFKISISSQDLLISPFQDLNLEFVPSAADVNLTFFPLGGLKLAPLSLDNFISATCEGCIEGSEYEITIKPSKFLKAFKFEPFSITIGPPSASPPVFSLSVPEVSISSSGFQVQFESNTFGLLTWCVVALDIFNETLTTFEAITEQVNNNPDKWDLFESVDDYESIILDIFNEYRSYEEIAAETILAARSFYLVGQSLVQPGSQQLLIDLNGVLTFGIKFKIVAYLDNQYENEVAVQEIEVETGPNLKSVVLNIIAGEDDKLRIVQVLSALLQISDKQISVEVSGNSLIVLIVSGVRDTVSVYDKISMFGLGRIQAVLGVNVTEFYEAKPGKSAEWLLENWDEVEGGRVVFGYTPSADGFVYCVVENSVSDFGVFRIDDIRFGIDLNGDPALDFVKTEVVKGKPQELYFDFLGLGFGVYDISCVTCDRYPLTPTCSSVSTYTIKHTPDLFSAISSLVSNLVGSPFPSRCPRIMKRRGKKCICGKTIRIKL